MGISGKTSRSLFETKTVNEDICSKYFYVSNFNFRVTYYGHLGCSNV
jgi:hypothetical protein